MTESNFFAPRGEMLSPYSLREPVAGYGRSLFPCVKSFVARHSDKDRCVLMKVVDWTSDYGLAALERLKAEKAILQHLRDSGVTGVVCHYGLHAREDASSGAETTEEEPQVVGLALTNYIASDYDATSVDWMTLRQFVDGQEYGRLDEQTGLLLIKNISSIVLMIHSAGVVLLDLSLDDVMYNTRTKDVVLVNFASARRIGEEERVVVDVNTPNGSTVAPDIVEGVPYPVRKADVWSMGAMLHHILGGSPMHEVNAAEGGVFGTIILDNGWLFPCEPAIHQYTQNFISLLSWPDSDDRANSTEAFAIATMCLNYLVFLQTADADRENERGEGNDDGDEEALCYVQSGAHTQPVDREELMWQILDN